MSIYLPSRVRSTSDEKQIPIRDGKALRTDFTGACCDSITMSMAKMTTTKTMLLAPLQYAFNQSTNHQNQSTIPKNPEGFVFKILDQNRSLIPKIEKAISRTVRTTNFLIRFLTFAKVVLLRFIQPREVIQIKRDVLLVNTSLVLRIENGVTCIVME